MALDLTTLANIRYNPFTGVWTPRQIGYGAEPVEQHTIPASGPYIIQLYEMIEQNAPSTTIITTSGGTPLTEVSFTTSPGNLQYRVCYDSLGNGQVEFNSAQAGLGVNVKYYGLGHILQKATIDGAVDYFDQYGYTKYTVGSYSNQYFTDGLYELIMIGAGAGGAGGVAGTLGGGGGGQGCVLRIFLRLNGGPHAITVGAKGAGGAINNDGNDGGYTEISSAAFSIRANGGTKGGRPTAGAAGTLAAMTGQIISKGQLTGGIAGTVGVTGSGCEGGRGGGPGGGAGGNGGVGGAALDYGCGGGGGDGSVGPGPFAGGNGSDGVLFIRLIQPA